MTNEEKKARNKALLTKALDDLRQAQDSVSRLADLNEGEVVADLAESIFKDLQKVERRLEGKIKDLIEA